MSQAQPALAVTEPFPGPRPFARSESGIFKGRTREARDLRDLVMSYQVVVLHSRSGAGKSSLVNAGLLPLLANEGFESWRTARVGGQAPIDVDASQIGNIFTFNALSSCLGDKFEARTALQKRLDEALGPGPDASPRLLILDQFEELFTNHLERWQDRKPFVEQLSALCKANSDLRVLIVIRDDYLAELDSYADMLPYSLRIRYRLERLTEDSALKGIVEPFGMADYSFESGVAEELVANLRRIRVQTHAGIQEIVGEFVEPVHLQVVCQNLWRNRPKESRAFSSDDVKKFGDVSEALRSFYEGVISATTSKSRVSEQKLRHWFEDEMITPDGTRGLVHMGAHETGGISNSAVDVLEKEHVIRAEPRAGGRWYEITHDRFIQPIRESNRAWFAKRRRRWIVSDVTVAAAALIALAVYVHTLHRRQEVIHEQSLRAQQLTHQRFLTAEAEVRQGKQAEQANQLEEALKHYQKALDLYSVLADPASQADVESRLGAVFSDLGRLSESQQNYEKACELHKRLANWKAAAEAEGSVGYVQNQRGALRESINSLKDALALLHRSGQTDRIDEGWILDGLGWSYYALSDYPDALDYFSEGRAVLDQEYKELSGQALGGGGSQGPTNEQRASALLTTISNRADASMGFGGVYAQQGRYRDSIDSFQAGLDDLRKAGSQNAIAIATANLGYAYFQGENYAKALSLFKEAETIDASPSAQQVALADESAVYLKQHQYLLSLEKANEVVQIAENQQEREWIGIGLWLQSLAYFNLSQLDRAQAAGDRAHAILTEMGDKEMDARVLDALGLVAEARHNREQALTYFQKAVDLNERIGCKTLFAKDAKRDLDRLNRSTREGKAAAANPYQ